MRSKIWLYLALLAWGISGITLLAAKLVSFDIFFTAIVVNLMASVIIMYHFWR